MTTVHTVHAYDPSHSTSNRLNPQDPTHTSATITHETHKFIMALNYFSSCHPFIFSVRLLSLSLSYATLLITISRDIGASGHATRFPALPERHALSRPFAFLALNALSYHMRAAYSLLLFSSFHLPRYTVYNYTLAICLI